MRNLAFEQSDDDISLEREIVNYLNRISLEQSFISKIGSSFSNMGGKLITFLSNQKEKLNLGLNREKDLSEHEYSFISAKLRGKTLFQFENQLISIPENFKGNLNNYAIDLNKTIFNVLPYMRKKQEEYTELLSMVITNKDYRKDSNDYTHFSNEYAKIVETENKRMSFYFPKETGNSVTYFKNVFSQLREVEEFFDKVTYIEKTFRKENIIDFKNGITDISDLAEMIIDNVNKSQNQDISPEKIKMISAGIFSIAKFAEFISILYYDKIVLLESANKLSEVIKKTK